MIQEVRRPTPAPRPGAEFAGSGACWGRALLRVSLCTVGLLLFATSREAQAQHQVTGRVTSSELAPLGGVNVMVKGTTIGTMTNASGNFALTARTPNDTLVFSSLGRSPQEVPIEGRTRIEVVLEQQAIQLEGLVVVGYGVQAKEVVTGSVSTVSSEQLEQTSATTTADALVGKIQGINTRMPSATMAPGSRGFRDGRPGSSTTLQIRNMGEPLFVIDGVPSGPDEFNHLNAADIETISILKDASASVYGFRAANGVVLVTTKRGASATQRPQLRVDGYYGAQYLKRNSLPHGWGNTAYQHQYAIIESQQNLGQARTMTPDQLDAWRFAPTYAQWPLVINNQNAPQANVNASLSGSAEFANYYLSVGHVTQDYLMRDNNFNRTNVQVNLRSNLFEGLAIGTELRAHREAHNTVASGASADPVQGMFRAVISAWPHENPWANGNPDYINANVRNLIRSPAVMNRATGGTQDQYRENVSGNLWTEYTFPFGMQARATYSQRYNAHQFDYHGYDIDAYCYDQASDTYSVCTTLNAAERQHAREMVEASFAQLQVSHSGQLGSHSLSGVAAYERAGDEFTGTELRSVPPTRFNSLISLVDVNGVLNTWNIARRASYIGRFNYDFEQKYLLEVLGRYDGSYLYAPDSRWGFFPGISAGWRLTEEPFLERALGFMDEMKLRVSWGEAGREQGICNIPGQGNVLCPAPWDYVGGATYGAGEGSVFDGTLVTGIRPRGLPVTNISWVTSTTRNVGVDFALLGRRLSGEIDLFERKLTGLPAARYDVVLPSEVGYLLPNENLDSEATRGIEAILRYNDQIGRVGFSIAPSATLARRKVLERYKPQYGNSWHEYRTATAHRWDGIRFDYKVVGQFQTMEEIANHPVNHDGQGNRTLLPGDWIFQDTNGDGIINELDMRPIGWGQGQPPVLSFGLTGDFSLGAFSLSYNLAGGHMMSYQPMNDVRLAYNTDHASGTYYQSRWRRADPYDDQSEWIPGRYPALRRLATSHSSNRTSDKTFLNVSYVRVRRVELGYRVPQSFGERFGFSGARVYASSSNPLWFDNQRHWNMDPEAAIANVYPTASVVNVGFSANVGGRGTPAPSGIPVPPAGGEENR